MLNSVISYFIHPILLDIPPNPDLRFAEWFTRVGNKLIFDNRNLDIGIFWKSIDKALTIAQLNPSDSWDHLEINGEQSLSREQLSICLQCQVLMDTIRLLEWNRQMNKFDLWESLFTWFEDSFYQAIVCGRIDKIDLNDSKIQEKLYSFDQNQIPPLQYAMMLGHQDMVDAFLQAGADINFWNSKIFLPPLHQAIQNNDISKAEDLLRLGARLRVLDRFGYTPLSFATINGNEGMVKWLLSKGDSGEQVMGWSSSQHFGERAYETAILRGHFGMIPLFEKMNLNRSLTHEKALCYLSKLATFKPKKYLQLFSILYPDQNVDKKTVEIVKHYLKTTSILHAMDLEVRFSFYPIDTNESVFETPVIGAASPYWIEKMIKAASLMDEKFPDLFYYKDRLEDVFSHFQEVTSLKLDVAMKRIQSGLPTLFMSGMDRHAVAVLIWGPYTVICNRGAGSLKPLEVFEYDSNKLEISDLEELIATWRTRDEYLKMINQEMPKKLGFKPKEQNHIPSIIESNCPLNFQENSTCSYASIEGIVWFIFAYSGFANTNKAISMSECKEWIDQGTDNFRVWQSFNQAYHLERYLGDRVIRKPKVKIEEKPYKLNSAIILAAFERVEYTLQTCKIDVRIQKIFEQLLLNVVEKYKQKSELFHGELVG